MKSDRMAKRASFGSIVRKRLSDITNSLPQQPKSPVQGQNLSQNTRENIEHLLQENVALMKLIAEKNKIIEMSGLELQKSRVTLQKMQMQNCNLAQSNSFMLAELNLGKDKLKSLQHQLVCKDALLKAKNLELEGQRKLNSRVNGYKGDDDAIDSKNCKTTRRHPLRSQSIGPSTTVQQASEKETVENKRRCLRRQSARFSTPEQEPKEDLFEIKDVKFSTSVQPLDCPKHEENPTSLGSSSIRKPALDRTSLGRPTRKAAEKIQCYKEVPINIKMRRSE